MNTKSLTKRFAILLAVAGGLIVATLAQAQDIYYWANFYPLWGNNSGLYSSWADYPNDPSDVNFNWVYNGDLPSSGLEVISSIGGYGSGYADLNGGVGVTFDNGDLALATNDTVCSLAFTVNPTPTMAGSGFYTNYNWIGLVFILNLDSGIYSIAPPNNYSGWNNPGNPANYEWNGSNVTVTWNLSPQSKFLTYTQGGTNHFYGCNIGIDPAVIFNDPNGSSGKPPYDITFNSITFAAAPPKPPNPAINFVSPNIVISWPDPNTNTFTLLQSANMARFSWSPWGFAPVWNNGTNTVSIPPPFNQELFFRLTSTIVPSPQ
ncbi:MAG TPA: hypothetical protein VH280_17915 [Verrucomicrobiae bacterium]|jgi:hypothetical protein|nr:hypothetical protein [Verrucomicrobiae bacterium]